MNTPSRNAPQNSFGPTAAKNSPAIVDLNGLALPQLFEELIADGSLERAVGNAIREDLRQPGDITSRSIISADQTAEAQIIARSEGIVAGLVLGPRIIGDGSIAFTPKMHDGDSCKADQTLAVMSGQLRRMLGLERIILNFIGRLCGIATATREYVDAIKGTRGGAVICDTRKTTPGLRSLEKYAVRCGGATLHRAGLFDAALYKDNHLAGIPPGKLAETLSPAIRTIRAKHYVRFVEVEADSLEQLEALLAVETGLIDIVLLDNMKPAQLKKAVAMRDKIAPVMKLEASGGVTLKTVRAIAETGVDRISIGAITHSAPALDIGLDIKR
jgi:nicotinate-nucleotide pyrophosphorylase (carboxylating)